MTISSLRINDFRNIKTADLKPCFPGLNLIYGNNGSGKTSLLEAIYYLGMGKSFKISTSSRLVNRDADKFALFAYLENDNARQIGIGVERNTTGAGRLRIAALDAASFAEITALMPIRVIHAHSHHLFESGPDFRRKYLDWGLFYESSQFLTCWRHYERALKQRNAVLRDKRGLHELTPWTDEMVKLGQQLNDLRYAYVLRLEQVFRPIAEQLLGFGHFQWRYRPGWDESISLASILGDRTAEDYALGYTQYGPHRADLEVTIDGMLVKHFLSRGQQKLLICAMIMAQGKLLVEGANKGLIYLIDDLPAELDAESLQKLISLLLQQPTQLFITAIESNTIQDVIAEKYHTPIKVFHVEHGSVTEQTMEHIK